MKKKKKICGENRNSYYKTDTDATAMVLKEDYYSKSFMLDIIYKLWCQVE